ncbi:hypothetical protein NA57DRAFT_46879 [Rhizodiscina lignyota]|uniref:Inositolphosphotransferase Aur1/Ipt1 domain-containing protein n=1 Tax=Rhizodiscina lignyota TaxID=1504668 RepID=A0A9P4I5N7_9PEZI|nr:hypothetical protein NA57DRAFT_46879 [Rhizodiscina lignyota]
MGNVTVPDIGDSQQWNSRPAWKLPGWAEPVIVFLILFGAMFFTRRKNCAIFDRRKAYYTSLLDEPDESSRDSSDNESSSINLLSDDDLFTTTKNPPKRRRVCGCLIVDTPNTSRFRNNWHSRLLQKFPFLIEMFYWIINYAFYRMTAVLSQRIFAATGIWEVAQSHGIQVLEIEQFAPLIHWLFPIRERNVQQWFMAGHQDALTVLNRVYALIHIPGTVGFIAWYYYVAPNHAVFATVRRTMTLTNFLAFLTFIFYPCMPPRLLPREYGFLDTVRHDDAQSVWMSGKYVNSLAAMPSMHFGYSFAIGCTLIYHSGIFRKKLEKGEMRKSLLSKLVWCAFGLAYPTLILVTIVSTANHYFLDAVVATLYVLVSFGANEIFYVFLPLEDWLLWLIRAEKPKPTTGERFR